MGTKSPPRATERELDRKLQAAGCPNCRCPLNRSVLCNISLTSRDQAAQSASALAPHHIISVNLHPSEQSSRRLPAPLPPLLLRLKPTSHFCGKCLAGMCTSKIQAPEQQQERRQQQAWKPTRRQALQSMQAASLCEHNKNDADPWSRGDGCGGRQDARSLAARWLVVRL